MSVKSESINEQVNGKSSKKITTKVSKTKMKRIKQNGDIDKVAICNGDTKARTVNGNTESSCPNGSANKASTKKKVPDVELIIESKRIRIPKSRDADLSAAKQIMKSSSSLSYNRKNPFDLVECQPFPLKPPFHVKLKLDALAIMDLHAHSLTTEVIGYLGGYFCRVTKTLHILIAEPCCSIDDNETTCEMDPVSQAIAHQKIEAKNLELVGWYHSHPTFSPSPSCRDIDSQLLCQNMFNQDTQSQVARPYVGVIIAPYIQPSAQNTKSALTSKSFQLFTPIEHTNPDAKFYANNCLYDYMDVYKQRYFTSELNSVLASKFTCFWVGANDDSNATLAKMKNKPIPYEVKPILIRDETFIPSITNKLSEVCQWINRDFSKSMVKLLQRYTRIGSINVTYMEKIISSLSYHLQNQSVQHLCTETESERIRRECVAIMLQELVRNQQNLQRS